MLEGMVQGCLQGESFRLVPLHRRGSIGEFLRDYSRSWIVPDRDDQGWKMLDVDGAQGLTEVVEHPGGRVLSFLDWLVFGGEFGCVDADEVVQAVAAGPVFGEQPGTGEFADERHRDPAGDPGEAGEQRQPGVRSGEGRQKPEQPCGLGAELPVGPGEDGSHPLEAVVVEGVEAAAGIA